MNHLYKIKDPYGKSVVFKPNWAQVELMADSHPCQITLKARQLGITTYYCIHLLDEVLWNDNVQCGVIAHTLQDAQSIFVDKLKYAFDHLHPAIRPMFRTVGDSAKELSFTHGSVIRVGTSLRSSTLQHLLISEYGKICAKSPEKAREVRSGALNTVAPGQCVYIESTAEGREGDFYQLCKNAEQQLKEKKTLGLLDFSFHFFPWWKEMRYSI